MKIQLLSDLHLETHPQWRAQPLPGADVLVLAGDIGSYQSGSLLEDSDFGLGQFSQRAGWPTPVLFVPGNHEYDGMDWEAAHDRLRDCCDRLGLVWLERTQWQATEQAVRFVGTTLWSDFDALGQEGREKDAASGPTFDGMGSHGENSSTATASTLRSREKAYRAANYYLRKTGCTHHGEPFLAESMRSMALECQAWLKQALDVPFHGQTVVVTHFAPSLRSADPRYGLTPGTAGFCNRLDYLCAKADLWLHGHLHSPSDYMAGRCRVIANPLGYARKNEQAQFEPNFLIETPHIPAHLAPR